MVNFRTGLRRALSVRLKGLADYSARKVSKALVSATQRETASSRETFPQNHPQISQTKPPKPGSKNVFHPYQREKSPTKNQTLRNHMFDKSNMITI
jgi:hypothetical protein